MNSQNYRNAPDAPGEGPNSFAETLSSLRVSPQFEARCEQAALHAYAIEKLRRERERRGFFAISIHSYLDRLAHYADVKVESVLLWAGVQDLQATLDHAKVLGNLLRTIGFAVEEAKSLVRVSFGEQQGLRILPARKPVFRGEGVELNELQRTNEALDEIEQGYATEVRNDLDGILDLVAYEFNHQ